jgi:nitroreductase/NAD-dependent dihydropyrimidine dehydrogenase PreA subunit
MTTILVDQDLCTRCGICSLICPMAIVTPADENTLPVVTDEKAGGCIQCGHCEAFCPSQALLLNVRPDEKVLVPAGAGSLSPEDLGIYLKKRRSIRHFTSDPVPRDTILEMLDIARYAASGGNGQPVQWIIVHDPEKVRTIAGLTIEWMKTLLHTSHPMSGYVPGLIRGWESGYDVICRGAPHLLFAHIPEDNPVAAADAIIALTHFDIAGPAFDVGTCWAGFVAGAASSYEPLGKEIGIPAGRKCAYALMFGHPQYKVYGIPRRKPLEVVWT